MKNNSKVILILAITLSFLLVGYFVLKKFNSCKYHKFSDTIVLVGFNVNNQINFKSINKKSTKYYLKFEHITQLNPSITLTHINIKGNQFNISGNEIEEGTCSPHIILEFKKK